MFKFQFDPRKAAANLRKHRVSFDEAISVFGDPLASTVPDVDHSDDEQRFITVGMSSRRRLLLIVYTDSDSGLRLISARLATANERKQYEEIS